MVPIWPVALLDPVRWGWGNDDVMIITRIIKGKHAVPHKIHSKVMKDETKKKKKRKEKYKEERLLKNM